VEAQARKRSDFRSSCAHGEPARARRPQVAPASNPARPCPAPASDRDPRVFSCCHRAEAAAQPGPRQAPGGARRTSAGKSRATAGGASSFEVRSRSGHRFWRSGFESASHASRGRLLDEGATLASLLTSRAVALSRPRRAMQSLSMAQNSFRALPLEEIAKLKPIARQSGHRSGPRRLRRRLRLGGVYGS